jgi:hypothetical protein
MRRYFFYVQLSTEQCHGYYRGEVRSVIVTADSGERVQLAFRHFQPYIQSIGISGRFRLTLNMQGAFTSLEKIN